MFPGAIPIDRCDTSPTMRSGILFFPGDQSIDRHLYSNNLYTVFSKPRCTFYLNNTQYIA